MSKNKDVPEVKKREPLDLAVFGRKASDLRVFIVGGGYQYLQMFYDAGFRGGTSVEDCDIVCFTGGEDVTPDMYGEKALMETHFNVARDERESFIYGEAIAMQKPMIGICRGSQFLNVMNGGKLWQDVNNHAIAGGHEIIDMRTGDSIGPMTSTHHQMMRPADDAEIIALASLSTKKKAASETMERARPQLDDVEVVWYPDSLCLCFQPHPEFKTGACRTYFLELVDEYIIPAT